MSKKYLGIYDDTVFYLDVEDTYARLTNASCSVSMGYVCNQESDVEDFRDTVLNKEDLLLLYKLDKESNIYGIGTTERLEEAKTFQEKVKGIVEKLDSKENKELFERIIEDEKDLVQEEFGLSKEEVEEIFENYPYEYQDKGIISHIFKSVEECGEEEFETYNEGVNDNLKQYINFEEFGKDLVYESESYYELESGKVVYYYM